MLKKTIFIQLGSLGIISLFLILAFGLFSYFHKTSQLMTQPQPLMVKTLTPKASAVSLSTTTASAAAVLGAEVKTIAKDVGPKPSSTLPKQLYTIALIGDSLIDTMGENTDYLQTSLSQKYPGTEFKLYNYGIGGQNIEQGLDRFNQPFNYKTRNYPPLPELKPDILIIGSFSYNPFPQHDVAKHDRLLQSMINQGRQIPSQVYVLAEIAPLKNNFGVGPGGVNWPADRAKEQADHIIEQLQGTVKMAQMENVHLINVFEASKVDGNYGNPKFVSSNDGIHPSADGQVFTADIIAKSLKF